MGNQTSDLDTLAIGTEDDIFDQMMSEVSLEIDTDYKEPSPNKMSLDNIKKIKSINDLYIYQKSLWR